MGRAPARMELITNEKSRTAAFKKRRDALFKKLDELTTLCDVKASCIIIHRDGGANPNPPSETWPPPAAPPARNHPQLHQLIEAYRTQSRDPGRVRRFGLSDFFQERKRKAEEELARVKKRKREAKYPAWFEPLSSWTGDELAQFDATLKAKIEAVGSRVEALKKERLEGSNQLQSAGGYYSTNNDDGVMLVPQSCYSSSAVVIHSFAAAAAAAAGGVGDFGFGANDDFFQGGGGGGGGGGPFLGFGFL